MPRSILVHLNVEAPAWASVEDLVEEIVGALEVGTDPDQTPILDASTVAVALAEAI
jgi:hypothetical protein